MKVNKVVLLLAVSLMIFSCKKDYEENTSNGNIVTQEFSVGNFTGINLDSECNITLKNGTTQKVTVTASDNIIKDINTTITGGVWLIDFKSGDNVATINKHQWDMTIESPNINYIENNGSGSIVCEDTLINSPLTLRHLSSGSTSILCNVSDLTTFHDASGLLTISGKATTNNFTKEGGGNFKAFGLEVNTYNMTKDGGGDCEIKAISEISGTMEGGGNVYYKGSPTINVQVNGGGQLIDAN